MIVRLSTRLSCTASELWQKISEPKSLQFVASPVLRFKAQDPGVLSEKWQVGVAYPLTLYLLGLIPLGRHTIRLVEVDESRNRIVSQEHGLLAPVWNHTITFHEMAPGSVHYTDEIEIHAGWFTPVVWLFAQLFYRHRHRRWKVLLRQQRC